MTEKFMLPALKKESKIHGIWKKALLFSLSLLFIHTYSQDYNYQNFNAEEGLSQSYIYTILQDKKGYLWLGTENGLLKYNGFGFENCSTGDTLADNMITCSIGDGECLWFGHMNGRVSFYNGKEFRAIDIPTSNNSPVTHFAKDPDGRIWASTYADGLMKLSREKGIERHYLFQEQASMVSFEFLSKDEILIGTTVGLLFGRLGESDKIELAGPVAGIPESKITCIRKMRNKSGFYIATENEGLFLLSTKDKQFEISRLAEGTDGIFTGIQEIFEDSRSNLWACSFGNGLLKIDLSSDGKIAGIKHMNSTNGFVSDNIKTIYEDREGNLWTGNYGEGLTRITPKTFSLWTFNKPLYGNSIFSIYISQQYRWIGTENGLMKMDPLTGRIVKFYGKGSGLPNDSVTAVYSADGKELWIGTEKNGLFRMEVSTERIRKFPIGNGALENSVTSIAGKGEQVWIGTKKGLCNINRVTHGIKWYSISRGGLPHNFINGLLIDSKGKLWISTRSYILSYIEDEKVHRIPVINTTGILVLGPIAEDQDSRIWVGSNGNGIFMIGPDSIKNLTVKEGLLSNYCYSLICDNNRNIWVGHKDGLSRIRTTDFMIKPMSQIGNITGSYGFNPNAVLKDQQERIWFGSDNGLISYDASLEFEKFPSPVLGITSLKVNDEERDVQDKIILPPGHYKIQIDFRGISLKEPTLVTYQYKLDGYDSWSEISKNTSVTYHQLSEGEYTFILNASSGDGAVTEDPLTLSIIIKKPLWKKWWFYALLGLSLILFTIFYIKQREYRFLIEKKILEEKVKARTNEIECQKNEIELQRDLINKKNANITSSILYARNIQNAILPPLELMDKLLPDSFIMSKPKDIVSGDFYWLAERDQKIIFTVADCTGHGVPGAFMSLLGITLLNEIVNVQGITKSDEIISNLRDRVIHSLRQSRKDITTSDGMDIALCVLEKDRQVIQYTGGMNELIYVRSGELNIVKADHLSVSVVYEDATSFTRKEIAYQKGDVFYLFSDGYQDQFGGKNDRKYLSHRFYKLLLEVSELPMNKQKDILEQKLAEWMQNNAQTDDITVMGIRL